MQEKAVERAGGKRCGCRGKFKVQEKAVGDAAGGSWRCRAKELEVQEKLLDGARGAFSDIAPYVPNLAVQEEAVECTEEGGKGVGGR